MKDIDMRANSPKLNKYPPALPEDIYSVDFFCRKRKISCLLFVSRARRKADFSAPPPSRNIRKLFTFFRLVPIDKSPAMEYNKNRKKLLVINIFTIVIIFCYGKLQRNDFV